MEDDVVIVAATRTAVGKFGGSLAKIPAAELGANVIKSLLAENRHPAGSSVRGHPWPGADRGRRPESGAPGVDQGRSADMVPAMTISKVCGTGLKAVIWPRRRSSAATRTS